jgi:transposase
MGEENTAVVVQRYANIKRGSVATDVRGGPGRDMLAALIAGTTDADRLADLARGRRRDKIPRRRLAFEGRVTDHHRFLLRMHRDHLTHLEELIGRLGQPIEKVLTAQATEEDSAGPFVQAVRRLTTIPGVRERVAQTLIAEIGVDVRPFSGSAHLASWAGMCPGNHESAGKRRSGPTTGGNRWLKQALVQIAWAASPTRETYLATPYGRQSKRWGRTRALIALGHTILVIVSPVLKKQPSDRELGVRPPGPGEPDRLTHQLVKRLESLGHKVTLEPQPAV